MGLFSKLRGEFIDIIEFLDNTQDTIVYRFERHGNEIKNNAKLIVREGQTAVFVNEGQIADIFTPGTYTLNTENLPVLSTLKGWKYGFNSPFNCSLICRVVNDWFVPTISRIKTGASVILNEYIPNARISTIPNRLSLRIMAFFVPHFWSKKFFVLTK